MEEKKSNLIKCCELTDKTIELFNKNIFYQYTLNRNDIFYYWRQVGLREITCVDCEKKLDEEYDRLKKDEHEKFKKEREQEEVEKVKKYQEEAKERGVINCLYSHFKNTPKKLKVVCD